MEEQVTPSQEDPYANDNRLQELNKKFANLINQYKEEESKIRKSDPNIQGLQKQIDKINDKIKIKYPNYEQIPVEELVKDQEFLKLYSQKKPLMLKIAENLSECASLKILRHQQFFLDKQILQRKRELYSVKSKK